MPRNHLDKLAEQAIAKHNKRRSILFTEEALGYLLQEHGRAEALRIAREMLQHIEDHG